MAKKLPIGLSDFREIIEGNYYYIDKSLFIKDIIDNGSNAVLIPRPRRFGKTLNLSMLKYFFEKKTEDFSKIFKELNIWSAGEEYRNMQGQFPVIYITLKDVKGTNYNRCVNILKEVIAQEYRRHDYLLKSGDLSIKDRRDFEAILNEEADEEKYESGLKRLSMLLYNYHNKKVIILIDEYDTPIHEGYFNGYYNEIMNFMRNFLSGGLKDNEAVHKSILSGILKIAKESIFSGLNNFQIASVINNDFSNRFGLLEDEVYELLRYYNIEFEIDEIRNWYNGYVFGDTTIYNPWSIINYAKSYKEGFRPYWVNTSGNTLIKELIVLGNKYLKADIDSLIRGESIEKKINDDIVFEELEKKTDAVWSFLLLSGYLKVTSKNIVNRQLVCQLKVPNQEVLYFYENIIREWFVEGLNVNQNDKVTEMLECLVNGDVENFEYIFSDFVIKTFSYFDPTGEEPERVYQAFALGLFVNLSESYTVKSNRESGFGRYDIVIIPKDKQNCGIIIEFKKVAKQKDETALQAAQKAIIQIEEKKYETELLEIGLKKIIKIGIAFDGKEVSMLSKIDDGLFNL